MSRKGKKKKNKIKKYLEGLPGGRSRESESESEARCQQIQAELQVGCDCDPKSGQQYR